MARWHVLVTVRKEGHDDLTLIFDHTPITIGGSPKSDVVLSGPYVSRTHAVVSISGGRLIYRDQSSNGSFLDGRRIDEMCLESTDAVTIPPFRMTFSLEVEQDQHTRLLGAEDEAVTVEDPIGRLVAFQLRLMKAPGDLMGRSYTFDQHFREGDHVTIGRAAGSQVCIDLQSVSRRHAAFTLVADGRWQVSDLGSRNGVEVNVSRVRAAVVADGDQITFGPDISVEFRQPTIPDQAGDEINQSADALAPLEVADDTLALKQQRSSVDQNVLVVRIGGRIDGYNYAEFRDQLNRIIDGGERLLLLDFSGCTFCDHVGLGVVLSAKTALDKHKGGLCLIGVSQMLREGLTLLRLNSLLAVESDEVGGVLRLVKPK